MMGRRGVFITLEGGDGTGKSTQVKLLQQALASAGVDAVATREPGGTEQAEKIRTLILQGSSGSFDPLTEALLMFASRREHIVGKIRPALDNGQWVISDRFADSTRAFQGYGMGLSMDTIEALYKMVAGDLAPDLTFIFDIDPEIGLARSMKRLTQAASGEDRYERMGLEFHKKLRQGFLDTAEKNPGRCVVIDASQSVEAVQAQLLKIVAHRFGVNFGEARHG